MGFLSSLGGGLLGGIGAYQAQRKLGEAGDAMFDSSNKAYEGGLYKPYGVTSGLGTTSFDGGNSSFTMDPRYQQQQDKMMGLGNSAFDAAGGDYNQLADQFYNQQRALGAGSRSAEANQLGGAMFGTGTTGLQMSNASQGFGADSQGTSNPYANMFMNNFAQQDSQDRNNAFDRAQQQRQNDINIGNSMFNNSMALDAAGNAQMMQGGQLGQYRSDANNAAGRNLVDGYTQGADYVARRGESQAGGIMGLGSMFGF